MDAQLRYSAVYMLHSTHIQWNRLAGYYAAAMLRGTKRKTTTIQTKRMYRSAFDEWMKFIHLGTLPNTSRF